jgi:glycosyltransferase involved in cell wall biosynthesis
MLVSAIMPTRGRQAFAEKALASFLSQTYADKELIILDDADDPSFDLREWPANIRYERLGKRYTVGAKRNLCCECARGELVVHWDSDDWSAPDRISMQVQLMQETAKSVVGFRSLTFYDAGKALTAKWCAEEQLRSISYALGSSLMYRRSWWETHRFPNDNIGEDNFFVSDAAAVEELHTAHGDLHLIARIHEGNTSPKDIDGMRLVSAELPAEFLC